MNQRRRYLAKRRRKARRDAVWALRLSRRRFVTLRDELLDLAPRAPWVLGPALASADEPRYAYWRPNLGCRVLLP